MTAHLDVLVVQEVAQLQSPAKYKRRDVADYLQAHERVKHILKDLQH